MNQIEDKFSGLRVTKQQRYKLRRRSQLCCTNCGRPSGGPRECVWCQPAANRRASSYYARKVAA